MQVWRVLALHAISSATRRCVLGPSLNKQVVRTPGGAAHSGVRNGQVMKLIRFIKATIVSFTMWLILELGILGIAFHAFTMVKAGRGLDEYSASVIDIPVLIGAKASYMDVLIMNTVAFVVLLIGMVFRYVYYKDELDLIKETKGKYKAKDSGFYNDFDGDDF